MELFDYAYFTANDALRYVLGVSISASVLIALIMLIRKIALGRMPKCVLAAMWLLPALKLMLPDTCSTHIMTSTLTDSDSGMYLDEITNYIRPAGAFGKVISLDLPDVLFYIWLFGAVFFMGSFLFRHMAFKKRFACSLPCESDIEELKKAFLIKRRVKLRVSDMTDTPFTYGVFSPVIIIPKSMAKSGEQFDNVLCHELAHIRRFDVVFKGILLVCACVHWFNPLMWAMLFTGSRDIELACDELAVKRGKASPENYAMTLIGMEERRLFSQAAFAGGCLEERIRGVMTKGKTSSRLICGLLAVIAVAAAAANVNISVAHSRAFELNGAQLIAGPLPFSICQSYAYSLDSGTEVFYGDMTEISEAVEGEVCVAYAYGEELSEITEVDIFSLKN